MNKAQKLMKLVEQDRHFDTDSDFWYDDVIDLSDSHSIPPEVIDWAKADHRPTEAELKKLKDLLFKHNIPAFHKVLEFIEIMEAGEYESEFKKMYGEHSQVSELFNFFKQAVLYSEYPDMPHNDTLKSRDSSNVFKTDFYKDSSDIFKTQR